MLNAKPLKLDSADAVPLHRPRFCWSNVTPTPMEGVTLEEKERWTHVHMPHEFPAVEQWIEEGWHWPGGEEGNLLPTCMKSIKRRSPPLKPAGLDRAYLTIPSLGGRQTNSDSPLINMATDSCFGREVSGGCVALVKGNCCRAWVLVTPHFVGTPGTLKTIGKGMRIPEKASLVTVSIASHLYI